MEWPKEPLDMRRSVGHLCGCTSVDVGPFLTDVLSGATAPTPLARLGVVVGASDADADSIRFRRGCGVCFDVPVFRALSTSRFDTWEQYPPIT
jgi:hypothetical protein